jgi:chemotaxis signal transduction protein
VRPRGRADSRHVSGVFVQLRVGAERYALPVEHVLEVTPLPAPTPLPGARRELLGLVPLRGRVLPVYDLGALVASGGDRAPARVVVVADGESRAGFAVDEVIEVGPLAEPSPADDPLLSGTVLEDGALVGIVDATRLLAGLAA